jgi:hypothetical protein
MQRFLNQDKDGRRFGIEASLAEVLKSLSYCHSGKLRIESLL